MSAPDEPHSDRRTWLAIGTVVALAAGIRGVVPGRPAGLRSPLEDLPWAIPDAVSFAANGAIGVAAVAGVYVLGLRLGVRPLAAVVSSAILAISAAHARFSHSDSPAIAAGALVVATAAIHAGSRGWVERILAGVGLGAAVALAPESLWVVPLVLVAPLAAGRALEPRDAVVAVGAALAVPFAGLPVLEPDHVGRAFAWTPPWTGLPILLASLIAVAIPSVPGRIRLWTAGWFGLAAVGTALGPVEHLASIERQLIALPGQALAAGIALHALFEVAARRGPVWSGVLAVAVLGASVPTGWQALRPTTAQQEYAFVAKQLHRIEPGCTILARLQSDGDVVAPVPPTRLSAQQGLDHTWIDLASEPQPKGGCQVWFRGAGCFASEAPVAEAVEGDLPVNLACQRLERGLNPRGYTVAHVGGARHSADHYPPRSVMQIGFFAIDVPVDPSIPVPSKPVPPRTAEQVEAERRALDEQIAAMPPWTPPPGWEERGLRMALASDPSCTTDEIRCSSGLCVAISTDPGCERTVWHGRTRVAMGFDVARLTWADRVDEYGAVAVALVPVSERSDPDVLARVNAMARLALKDALYE